jgi:hypothetical protein
LTLKVKKRRTSLRLFDSTNRTRRALLALGQRSGGITDECVAADLIYDIAGDVAVKLVFSHSVTSRIGVKNDAIRAVRICCIAGADNILVRIPTECETTAAIASAVVVSDQTAGKRFMITSRFKNI